MDKKGSKENLSQASRSKRRKVVTVKKNVDTPSTSGKNLQRKENLDIIISSTHGYCVLNFFAVFSAIASLAICKNCKGEIEFSQAAKRGLGFKIAIKCKCGEQRVNSSPIIDETYEVNQRIVLVMRLLGIGREGINLFCGLMDLCQGLSIEAYCACLRNLHVAASAVYKSILSAAVEEEKKKNEEAGNVSTHLTVSGGDGTWRKRGFSSLFGVSALVGKYSKKVLDTVVKSSFCQGCSLWKIRREGTIDDYNDWYEDHKEQCTINHVGGGVDASKMEVDAITEMFRNSEEKYGVKYKTYVGDGDSKTFRSILNTQPYGDTVTVEKKECVEHAEKRMGTRLRNAKRTMKGLGGKLPDEIIDELTEYYGLAIRRHANSLSEMKRAVWAMFYHKSSTNENPQHTHCPSGETSWCKWRQAEAIGKEKEFIHERPPLTDHVLTAIKPIYDDLSSDELLNRCLGAERQNGNESLHSLIWLFAPKHMHSGLKTIEIATFLAVNIFNEGFSSIQRVFNTLGIVVGQQMEAYILHANLQDKSCIQRSERRPSEVAKRARNTDREEKSALQDFYEHEEGPLYRPLAD